MYRTEIQIVDAIFSVRLINLTNGVQDDVSKFPTDSMATYKEEGMYIQI